MTLIIFLFIGMTMRLKRNKRRENVMPVVGSGKKPQESVKEHDDDWKLANVEDDETSAGTPSQFKALDPPSAPQPEQKSSHDDDFLKPDDHVEVEDKTASPRTRSLPKKSDELEGTPWEQHIDRTSGEIFFFNTETQETSWQHPLASDSLPHGWSKHADPESGRHYYYNELTDETSWVPPSGKQDAAREAERTSDGDIIFDEA